LWDNVCCIVCCIKMSALLATSVFKPHRRGR
jgi:hypothetical protein